MDTVQTVYWSNGLNLNLDIILLTLSWHSLALYSIIINARVLSIVSVHLIKCLNYEQVASLK